MSHALYLIREGTEPSCLLRDRTLAGYFLVNEVRYMLLDSTQQKVSFADFGAAGLAGAPAETPESIFD